MPPYTSSASLAPGQSPAQAAAAEEKWQAWYLHAAAFFQSHGHLIVPPKTSCPCGNLHSWVNDQRVKHTKGILPAHRAALLEQIGIVWQVRQRQWDEMYALAREYFADNGHLMVPRGCPEHKRLVTWIANQRKDRRAGRPTLTPQCIALLDQLNMVWEPYKTKWEHWYRIASLYYKKHGHLLENTSTPLGCWLSTQRTAKVENTISAQRQQRLEQIGMVWDVLTAQWEQMYEAAKTYYAIHEQLNVPAHYITPDGLPLGSWISKQRRDHKQFASNPSPQMLLRFEKLNAIEMIWDASCLAYFTSFPKQAIMFYLRQVCPDACKKNVWEPLGIEIDVYLPSLKAGIEYNGIFHREKEESDNRKNLICLQNNIRLFRIREQGLPCLSVPSQNIVLESSEPQALDKAILLLLSALQLPPLDVNTQRDQAAIREMYKDLNSSAWDRMYEAACAHYHTHGSLAFPFPSEENASLRGWLTKQRRRCYEGLLTNRQLQKLMKLHFLDGAQPRRFPALPSPRLPEHPLSSGSPPGGKWEKMYLLAQKYYEENGHLQIPQGYLADGFPLGKWISAQRRRRKNGQILPVQIHLLDRISMVWNPKAQAQAQWLAAARAFFKENGHINPPLNYKTEQGQLLGHWVANARTNYKKGKLDPQLITALEQMGIHWNPLTAAWEEMYAQAQSFYRRNGHLCLTKELCTPQERQLMVWVQLQRQKYNKKPYMKGSLSPEQIRCLNEIGMVWDPYAQRWLENYAVAKAYYVAHGHLRIPGNYVINGRNIGMWLSTQRQAARGNPNYSMSPWKRRLLDEIAMEWHPPRRRAKKNCPNPQ